MRRWPDDREREGQALEFRPGTLRDANRGRHIDAREPRVPDRRPRPRPSRDRTRPVPGPSRGSRPEQPIPHGGRAPGRARLSGSPDRPARRVATASPGTSRRPRAARVASSRRLASDSAPNRGRTRRGGGRQPPGEASCSSSVVCVRELSGQRTTVGRWRRRPELPTRVPAGALVDHMERQVFARLQALRGRGGPGLDACGQQVRAARAVGADL